MEKKGFLKEFEDVMGVSMTKEELLIGLVMIAGLMLVLQVGEMVHNFLSSIQWV